MRGFGRSSAPSDIAAYSIFDTVGDTVALVAALDEARALCEQLLGERPSDIPLRSTLADTHWALGSLDWDEGRPARPWTPSHGP